MFFFEEGGESAYFFMVFDDLFVGASSF